MAKEHSRITEDMMRKFIPNFRIDCFFSRYWRHTQRFCVIKTHTRDVTRNFSRRKRKKTLKSVLKTKLNPFKNIINLSEKRFSEGQTRIQIPVKHLRRNFLQKLGTAFNQMCLNAPLELNSVQKLLHTHFSVGQKSK